MNYEELVRKEYPYALVVTYFDQFTIYSQSQCGTILSKDCLSATEAWKVAYRKISMKKMKKSFEKCNCTAPCKCKNPRFKYNIKKQYTKKDMEDIVEYALNNEISI